MKNLISRIFFIAGLLLASTAFAQTSATQSTAPADSVAVVIQITLVSGVKPEAAMTALNDMRAFVKKQPGYLSSEFLQNYNAANSPT